jgi:glycosyltransferase involved in cell wall biosynthesis
MKLAFVYGSFSIGGRLFDFKNLWDSPRGLTGSELSCIVFASEMVKRGHDVSLHIEHSDDLQEWNGIKLRSLQKINEIDSSFDVALAWNEPDALREVKSKIRFVNQQLNDFAYCKPDFDNFVDVYTSPSDSHLEYIHRFTPNRSKWEVLPNGCNPNSYDPNVKVPGRVIYASSPDRGLHLLLQAWPHIKRKVPAAHLRIFYNIDDWVNRCMPIHHHDIIDMAEYGCRARYISLALQRMRNMDIQKIGSVSRTRMAREMSEAMTLAYPCDTARFTEGFSVTTLEACASWTVPVISNTDSLGQIYEDHVPTVQHPIRDRLPEFQDLVIRSLTDPAFREEAVAKSRALALTYSWDKLVVKLEKILEKRLSSR